MNHKQNKAPDNSILGAWLSAARPRTLPLALASIFMGSFLAYSQKTFDLEIFIYCCLTTISLQILSNFANDYGDTQNGADSAERIGPQRAVQSGIISPQAMFRGIILFGLLSLFLGITLIYLAFRNANSKDFTFFLILGLFAIIAAYNYTAGKKPYGYAGFGDISVFIFFGLIGVLGSNYLYNKNLEILNLLPAISCGLFSTAVLNINNIRDIDSDSKAGKKTIPVRLGKAKSIHYHWFLLITGMVTALLFSLFKENYSIIYILSYPLFIINGIRVSKLKNPDPMLKQMALSTLAFVILFGISINL